MKKTQIKKPTVSGLSLQTGIDRKTVRRRLLEAGLYPPTKHSYSDCVKAIRPTGKSTTLEDAKTRLLDAKIRSIERAEKLSGGELLPTNWFVQCVTTAFHDHFGNCFQSIFDDAEQTLKNLQAPYVSEGWTSEKSAADELRHDQLKEHLFQWIAHARESLRISTNHTRGELIRHLRNGTMASGGQTSFGEFMARIDSFKAKLSDSALAEIRAAMDSK